MRERGAAMSDVDKIVAFRKMQSLGVNTLRQAVALLAINYQDRIGSIELAKVIGSNRAHASALCKQLVLKGLLDWHYADHGGKIRNTRKDSRVYYLTSKGKRVIEQAR